MKTILVFACLFTAVTFAQGQPPKFDWIHSIGDAGDDIPHQIEVDSNGNVYLVGSFLGEIVLGSDTLKSETLSNPASFLAKFDSIGKPVWARKLPMSNPSSNPGPSIKRMRLSPHGKIYMLGNVSTGSYIAVFRNDGSIFNYAEGAWNASWTDVDFDSVDNAYLLGAVGGTITSFFIAKYDSLAYKKWEYYYSTQENIGKNIKIANSKVNVFGQFKGQIQLFDTVGSTPITLNAVNFNALDLFTATYSLNGQLLSGAVASGIPPIYIGGGPEYTCDISPSQGWFVGWVRNDPSGSFFPNIRRHGFGFVNSNTPVIPFSTNCPFAPSTYTKNSIFKNEGVLSWIGFLCSSSAYKYDSMGIIKDSLILPSVISTVDFSFNRIGDNYVTAEYNGSITYQDNTGLHTLISKSNTNDIYIAKYHTCPIYSPTISQTNDTLSCSLTGMNYQWYLDNNPISGANGQKLITTQSGNYYVVVSDTWDCKNASSPIPVTVGIRLIANTESLYIYPNPTSSILSVRGVRSNTTIEIHDLAGRVVEKLNTSKDCELNISDLQKGMYLIRIGNKTTKFTKL